MSVQTIHFNDTFITNEPLKIELIDIAESSDLTEKLLNVLLDVYNEKGSFAYHGETTHIVALYDNGEVVGGALLRVSFRVVVVNVEYESSISLLPTAFLLFSLS